ncbi:MAG: hypothetical protein VX438_09985, partial [Planctomycetota bacterium]|nr:hypothetical protein [Planctomycetota bacterium]
MKIAWRIREKLLASAIILVAVVSVLSYSSFHGASRFRGLTKSIRARSSELPLAANLGERISELRVTFLRYSLFKQIEGLSGAKPGLVGPTIVGFVDDEISLRQQFLFDLEQVNLALKEYESQLLENVLTGKMLLDIRREKSTVLELKEILANVTGDFTQADWIFNHVNRATLDQDLNKLQEQVTLLPGFLSQRMNAFH